MTYIEEIENRYFDWMCRLVCQEQISKHISYTKLLAALHSREFYFILPMDENRAGDGIDLREQFAWEEGLDWDDVEKCIGDKHCSVLEMMVGLARRIEVEIIGTTQEWFWLMIYNMGLNDMIDVNYDREKVMYAITVMLDRRYCRDGKGGLFCVKNHEEDLREVEIWYQMQWYINEIYHF